MGLGWEAGNQMGLAATSLGKGGNWAVEVGDQVYCPPVQCAIR